MTTIAEQAGLIQVTHESLTVGLRVDYRGDTCNPDGEGVIERLFVNENEAGIAGAAAGELWSYKMVAVKLDDGREIEVTIESFNAGPLGGLPSFTVAEDQTPPDERQAEATVDEVVGFLRSFKLGETARRPLNFVAARISADWYHLEICGVWWELCDNGGEFMVGRLNSDELRTAVPLSAWRRNLNPATVAHRVAQVLRGEPIDYDFEISDEDQQVLAN